MLFLAGCYVLFVVCCLMIVGVCRRCYSICWLLFVDWLKSLFVVRCVLHVVFFFFDICNGVFLVG